MTVFRLWCSGSEKLLALCPGSGTDVEVPALLRFQDVDAVVVVILVVAVAVSSSQRKFRSLTSDNMDS